MRKSTCAWPISPSSPLGEHAPGGLHHRPVAVVLADRELAVEALRRLDQCLAVVARAGQRLLHEHGEAGREAALGDVAMRVRWHNDDGDVGIRVSKRFVEVDEPADAVDQRRRVLVDERDLLGARLVRQRVQPGPAEPARSHLQDLHSLMPPSVRPPTM